MILFINAQANYAKSFENVKDIKVKVVEQVCLLKEKNNFRVKFQIYNQI